MRTQPSAVALLFGATLFMSAALIFCVQPMFARMALPQLGGSPNVWNTCVVFFQAALLTGYLYAHVITTRLPLGAQRSEERRVGKECRSRWPQLHDEIK